MEFYDKLKAIKQKYDKITEQLSEPGIINDQPKYVALNKERSDLSAIVKAYKEYDVLVRNIEVIREIIESGEDKDLTEIAESELGALKEKMTAMEEKIKILLVPKDPDDDRNVIMEIRAGTGGDEAGLFAADLYRMYSWYRALIVLHSQSDGLVHSGLLL